MPDVLKRHKSNHGNRPHPRHSRFESCGSKLGHTPSTAGTFRRKFRKCSEKTPETLSELFLEFPSRVQLGCPKPYNSRDLKPPEHFQNSLPPQYGWGRFFFQKWFRRGPLRAGHGIASSTGDISEKRLSCQGSRRGADLTCRCHVEVIGRSDGYWMWSAWASGGSHSRLQPASETSLLTALANFKP